MFVLFFCAQHNALLNNIRHEALNTVSWNNVRQIINRHGRLFLNAGNKERRECGGHLQVLPGVVLNNMDLGEGGILAEGISNLIQITKSNFNPSRLMICGDKTMMQTSNSELVQKVPSSEFALRKKTWRANTAEVGC